MGAGGAKARIEGASIADTTKAVVITTMVGSTTATNWARVMNRQSRLRRPLNTTD